MMYTFGISYGAGVLTSSMHLKGALKHTDIFRGLTILITFYAVTDFKRLAKQTYNCDTSRNLSVISEEGVFSVL